MPEEPAESMALYQRILGPLKIAALNKVVFGEPIEHEAVKIIPVAKVRYGFGGGSGTKKSAESGGGIGGGLIASPVGYIEINKNHTQFVPIKKPPRLSTIAITTLVTGLLLKKIFRK